MGKGEKGKVNIYLRDLSKQWQQKIGLITFTFSLNKNLLEIYNHEYVVTCESHSWLIVIGSSQVDAGAWWAAVHRVATSWTRLSDFTLTFSLSYIGEGNGNPLQCSCLENPRDGGAWWAAIYGVAQSRTLLK